MAKPKQPAAKSAKSRGGDSHDVTKVEDFIKKQLLTKLLRGGCDPKLAEKCCDELGPDELTAVAHECGWEQNQGEEDDEGDKSGGSEDEGDEKPKGMHALGPASWFLVLWQNRDSIAKIVQTLYDLFTVGQSTQGNGDGSTRSASANQNS